MANAPFHLMRLALPLQLILCLPAMSGADDIPWRTGVRFRSELHEPITANWRSVELRSVLQQISLDREVSILLDRRVDPTVTLPVEFVNQPLKDGLTKLAQRFQGGCSVPDNVVYLGPRDSVDKLRTLIALRTEDLASSERPVSKERQQVWLKTRTVRWDDLDSPRAILDRLQADLNFRIENPAQIEHDLWAEAVLPQVNGIEALSLILIQFDLTFGWQDAGQAIELVPAPATVRIERRHKPRGKSVEKTLADWQANWPHAEFQPADREIIALATLEEQEEISAGKPARAKPALAEKPIPLDRRQFTLKIKDVSAQDLMIELEKSGIVFDYAPETLAAEGIDLSRFVELDVRKLSADEFFHALFDPLGVKFTIDGLTVTLKPK